MKADSPPFYYLYVFFQSLLSIFFFRITPITIPNRVVAVPTSIAIFFFFFIKSEKMKYLSVPYNRTPLILHATNKHRIRKKTTITVYIKVQFPGLEDHLAHVTRLRTRRDASAKGLQRVHSYCTAVSVRLPCTCLMRRQSSTLEGWLRRHQGYYGICW